MEELDEIISEITDMQVEIDGMLRHPPKEANLHGAIKFNMENIEKQNAIILKLIAIIKEGRKCQR